MASVVYICQSQSPNSSYPPLNPVPRLVSICFISVCLFLFENKIIYIIFLDSTYMHSYTCFSLWWLLLLQSAGSVVVVEGLSCPAACEIFLDQRLNQCPSAWARRFLTTKPPRKSQKWFLEKVMCFCLDLKRLGCIFDTS